MDKNLSTKLEMLFSHNASPLTKKRIKEFGFWDVKLLFLIFVDVDLQRRWTSIRKKIGRMQKKMTLPSGSSAPTLKKQDVKFLDAMEFLKDFVVERNRKTFGVYIKSSAPLSCCI